MDKTILTSDKIIRVTTKVTEEDRVVDFDDIETEVSYDEIVHEAPWERCDGWEHEFIEFGYNPHEGYDNAQGTVHRSEYSDNGFIDVDSGVVENMWGCVGYVGCSKQVRAESIARAKRKATIQLVDWYENGWENYCARAEYGDYQDSCCGIDCVDYAETVAQECRHNVAYEMEEAGYIIINQPEVKPYCRVSALRDKIRRQLDCS